MRIALVSPYDFATHGGVNQHVSHLGREFEDRGHEVCILAPLSEDAQVVHTPGFYGFGGIVPIAANGSVVRLSVSPSVGRVRSIMREMRFDIVHCHEPLTPVLPLAVLNFSRSVNVGTFHAYAEASAGYFYTRPVLQMFFRRLHGLVAVSEVARDFVSQYFMPEPRQSAWRIIPNGVDVDAFGRDVEPIREIMDGRPNILFLGRFDEDRKGFKYLIKALPWVKQLFPDVRVVVVGYGEQERYFSRLRRRGLMENVVFAGVVSDEDRLRYMRSVQFLVAPSTHGESQGIVLLEAMAAGLPVVAGNIPGYAGLLSHGLEGLLVRPANEHALAIAMVRLLSDAELRRQMGAHGRATAMRYSWKAVSSQVLEFYSELLDRYGEDVAVAHRRSRFTRVLRRGQHA